MYSITPRPKLGPSVAALVRWLGRRTAIVGLTPPTPPTRRSLVLPALGLPALVLGASGVLGLTGTPIALASAPPVESAVVLSASADPGTLPPGGGTISVQGTVANALLCQLQLLSSQSFTVVYSHNPRSCSSGTFSAQVTVGPNNTAVQRTLAFALVASNHTSTSSGRFYVLLAAPKPAAVLSVTATPTNLSAAGGIVSVAAKVQNAAECQLQLLSGQSFAVVYSHNPKSCSTGTYSASITIGPNNTAVARTVAFALVASENGTDSADRFYVLLAGGSTSTTSTNSPPSSSPQPPNTTTVPTVAGASQPPATMDSSNWSGYATGGGPYTEVKGTFTVPGLASGTPSFDQVSEWVGIDGANGNDTALIQAGVDEYPDPESPQGYDVQPWWEILPAAETDITTMTVKVGDSVSVTIWKVSGTTFEINLTDHTNGQSFTSPPEQYTGPGSTAEWIVEATSRCRVRCETTQLAPYSPAVAFSNLGMTGPEGPLAEISMAQEGMTVSSPSSLTSAGFNVTYTGTQLAGGPIKPVTKASVTLPGIRLNEGFARVKAS
ncbi:MAG TPA: G1 family glutamic endopeptidase [Acidimicrobiales bacterium]|nr:G1 family glutamic endopeptidase [Acidimicrobiales bacterium]